MDFTLSDDQRMVQETFARFCDERIIPNAQAIDEAHEYPFELFQELGELGFFGMRYPEDLGGTNQDLLSLCLALTEISQRLSVPGRMCCHAITHGHELCAYVR